jgi:hypothetical protein
LALNERSFLGENLNSIEAEIVEVSPTGGDLNLEDGA